MEQSGARASKQLGAITAIAAGIEGGQQEQVLSWSKVKSERRGRPGWILGGGAAFTEFRGGLGDGGRRIAQRGRLRRRLALPHCRDPNKRLP